MSYLLIDAFVFHTGQSAEELCVAAELESQLEKAAKKAAAAALKASPSCSQTNTKVYYLLSKSTYSHN